ncbi:MAG: porin family protein, partial [Chitinophagaceae bacterium]
MNHNFEHKVQQALDGFAIEPSGEAWKNIEQQLPTKKKKRFAFWWVSAAAISLISGIHFINTADTKRSEKLNDKKVKSNAVTTRNENVEIKSSSKTNINQVKKTNKVELLTDYIFKAKDRKFSVQKKQSKVNTNYRFKTQKTQKEINPNINGIQSNNISNNTVKKEIENEDIAINTIKNTTQNFAIIEKSLQITNPTKSFSLNKDFSIKNTFQNSTISKTASTKKWQMSLALGAGVQQISTNNLFINDSKSENNTSFSNTGGGGFGAGVGLTPSLSASNNYRILPLPNNGLNFKIGLTATKQITKTFAVSTGVLYQYTQNKSLATLDSVSRSNLYFVEDINNFITNKSHNIQLPVVLNTNILKSKIARFYLITGITANWVISSNYLQQSSTQNLYVLQESNYNKLLWNMQAGVGINFNEKWFGSITLNQGLTPIHNTGVKNYFTSIDAMFSIPVQ